MAGSVVWIVIVAALLAGVVAMNVAVLRLNVELEQLARTRAELRAENARLGARLSSASAGSRVEALARARGLAPAEPADTGYVDLTPRRR